DPALRDVLRQSCKTYASSPRVPLPDPRAARATPPFADVAAPADGPRSGDGDVDEAGSGAVDVGDLSRLLLWACGVPAAAPDASGRRLRAVPSADGLHPLETYVIAADVDGLAPGIYHFNAWLHCLEALDPDTADGVRRRLDACLPLDEGAAGTASAALAVTATPARICAVHGDRGYRMLLAEAGGVGHALHLGARALGLRAREVHSFFDARLERLLEIDGVDEIAVGLHLLGTSPGDHR
ncbi:MAG TPA: SagB/ThcOx family dehydrogenase, partial [Longimicrobiaceae bacterium]|nr:SagB/ThcOx family dehydrogenase [Longimicrobiaceae bacterium]